jgi:hypothetical protein
MSAADLNTLERDVEQARVRFAADLARVRSPTTVANFKDDLLTQALETKNEFTQRVLQDIRARALANPVAVLAIGAGLAWRLARHPPIASALIGFGLVSLMRTSPQTEPAHEAAARRLSDATSRAKELADSTRQKVEHWADDAREQVRESVQGLSERASAAAERAGVIAEEASNAAQEAVSQLSGQASEVAHRASGVVRDVGSDPDKRDKLLLGAATLAVTAAVGIAYQRRMQERHREAA